MDPPPHPTTTTTSSAAAATQLTTTNPDSSTTSSPRGGGGGGGSTTTTWNNDAAVVDPLPPKLRLMCSYGGHIIPRPDNKTLCYVGGDTRIVVADRHALSLSSLSHRLSRTLLSGRHFTLKYQLPNEDLDSLISVTTDEDLENMIEEYDRTISASPLKPSRLRLFLFLAKPETSTSMGSLLDDAKSETWFVDALNGSGLLPRGLSDSAAIDCFLELDDSNSTDLEAQIEINKELKNNVNVHHELNSTTMPDSPMVETNSSFGSSSSSPSMSNLPPIRVRVEENGGRFQEQMVGLDEQFLQMNVGVPPPPISTMAVNVNSVNSGGVSGGEQNSNRVFSDDERSDHGAVQTGFRKPPLPLQPVVRKFGDAYNLPSPDSKVAGGGFSLPSPDSVASDTSIGSATSLSKQAFYQDPTQIPTRENRAPSTQMDPKPHTPDPSSQTQIQQIQDSLYTHPPQQQQQLQQQQFIHPNTHYIHHHQPQAGQGPGQVPSYYQMYAPQSQQQYHPHMDQQQYPIYLLPISQTQPNYSSSVQSNIPNPTMASSARPITQIPAPNKPEMCSSMVYRTAGTANPNLVQVPSNQFQQQYMGIPQMHHHNPSQSIANYGLEYANPTQEQVYYPMPAQYQTMTAAAAVLLSQPPTQVAPANDNASSQPL